MSAGVATAGQGRKAGVRAFLDKHHAKLWWLHSFYALGLGVLVMFFAQKGYDHSRWLFGGVVGLWLVLVAFYRAFGERPEPPAEGTAVRQKVGFFVMTYVMKNLYQGMLFFLLPFYFRSTTFGSPNQYFFFVLALAAVLATLDIVFDRFLMKYRWASATYFFIALFAALNLALPTLLPDLGPRPTLMLAMFLGTAGYVSLHLRSVTFGFRRLRNATILLSGAAVGLSLVVGPVIPPVPYYILEGSGIGPSLVEPRRLSSVLTSIDASALGDLVALTAVLAPGASAEGFRHVWRKNGEEFTSMLAERGEHSDTPNTAYLRSQLRRSELPTRATGHWTVDVVATDGRVVGRVGLDVLE